MPSCGVCVSVCLSLGLHVSLLHFCVVTLRFVKLLYTNMNEWMSEWVSGWMDGWINQSINQSMSEWINEWMNQWVNESMNQWMNEWMNQWMNEWMNEWIVLTIFVTCWIAECWLLSWIVNTELIYKTQQQRIVCNQLVTEIWWFSIHGLVISVISNGEQRMQAQCL